MIVSFCVIAYNEEKVLESLFYDISKQTYPHAQMEIILVDSHSTDRTKYLMEKYSTEEHGFISVRVLDNPKRIQAAGWNVAIRQARGDIIMRIDAHTSIPEDFVNKNVNAIMQGEDVTGGPRPNIVDNENQWTHTLFLAESSMFGSSIAPFRKGQRKTYVKSVFHGAYRREVFEKVGLFNENLGRTEDNEMHYRIRKAGYKICYNPEIVSYQHVRSTWLGMIKQKFGNGYWVGLTVGICPGCLSIYHFVPACFVLAVVFTTILALLGFSALLFLLCLVYAVMNVLMSLWAIVKQKKSWCYILLPVIFLSLHFSYGFGTLLGIVKMPFWKKKTFIQKI